ncbi:MAG: alpha/beta fold hydrolase [Candidatus Micrarchaeota archaeon]
MRAFMLLAAALLLLGCTAAPQQSPAPAQPALPSGQPTGTAPSQEPVPSEPAAPAEETVQPAEQPPAQPVTSLENEEFIYNSGIWKIHGTLYASKEGVTKKAIVLVPMLGKDRNSYPISFIEKLHSNFPDALILAIDPRGHGESDNQGSWESFNQDGFRDMKTDILNIKKNLEPRYPSLSQLYVVGASMGSTSAINAAVQDKAITKVVMLSPGMEYRGVDIRDALEDYIRPVYVVASSGDSYSAQSISEIEALSSRPEMEKRIYSGSAHGTDMFAATEGTSDSLEDVIVEFLK